MRKIIPLLLQSLVTLGLLVWIFWPADFRTKTWEELAAANPVWLAAGFGAAGVVNFLGAFRWGIFLWVLGVRLPAWQVLRLSFVGLFFNIFLVGAVGGDAVKVVWLVAKGHPKTPALLSVFMDRMSGFGAMVVCSLLFIFLRLDWLMRSEVVADVIKTVRSSRFRKRARRAFAVRRLSALSREPVATARSRAAMCRSSLSRPRLRSASKRARSRSSSPGSSHDSRQGSAEPRCRATSRAALASASRPSMESGSAYTPGRTARAPARRSRRLARTRCVVPRGIRPAMIAAQPAPGASSVMTER